MDLLAAAGYHCQTLEARDKVLVLAIMKELIQAVKALICIKDIMLIDLKVEELQSALQTQWSMIQKIY